MPTARQIQSAAADSSCMASVRRFCQKTYAFDYIGLAILVVGYTLSQIWADPFHTMFSLDDPHIQYPHAKVERVPLVWLLIYSIAGPFAIVLVYLLAARSPAHKVHVSLLGLSVSYMLAAFITNAFKNGVGRPRPDLLDRCKPRAGTPHNTLVTVDVCTETNRHTLHDGWRSFPSGHSSSAFSGLGFLSLFFAGQFHVFRPHSDLLRVLVTLIPLMGAGMIAVSRLEDYRHGPIDVTVGSLLGFGCAYFSYRRYYPKWRSPRCDKPHKYPMEGESGSRDEELGGRPDHRDFELADDSEDEEPLRANRRTD